MPTYGMVMRYASHKYWLASARKSLLCVVMRCVSHLCDKRLIIMPIRSMAIINTYFCGLMLMRPAAPLHPAVMPCWLRPNRVQR